MADGHYLAENGELMPDQRCNDRITALEIHQKQYIRDFKEHTEKEEKEQKVQAEKLDEYHKVQGEMLLSIQQEQANQKGFWRGMVFGVSGIFTLLGVALSYFFNK